MHHNDVGFQRGAIVFLGPESICDTRRNEVIARVLGIALQKRRVRPLGSLELARRPLLFSPLQQLAGCQGWHWRQRQRLGCGACGSWRGSRRALWGALVRRARRGCHWALSLHLAVVLPLSDITPRNIHYHPWWRM